MFGMHGSETAEAVIAKSVLASFLQKRKTSQDIPVGTISPQVHGSTSQHMQQHPKPPGLLASQFVLMEDSNEGNKLVTCAICMAVFFTVNETIGHLQNAHGIRVDVNDIDSDITPRVRAMTDAEKEMMRNFRSSIDNLIENTVKERIGDRSDSESPTEQLEGGVQIKEEPPDEVDVETDEGTLLKVKFPRVAPVTGTPRSLGQLQIDPTDPSPSQSATSSESSSPVPSASQSRRKQKAPRRMTEPNEEVEPLVIEPRPELLQVAPSTSQTREENKPTTICLICGHVLFKKDKEDCHDIFARPTDPGVSHQAGRISRVLQRPLGVKSVASRYACSDCLKKVKKIEEADQLRAQLQAQFSHVESLHQPIGMQGTSAVQKTVQSRVGRAGKTSTVVSQKQQDEEWAKTIEAAQRAAAEERSQASNPAASQIAMSLAQAAIAQQMQLLRGQQPSGRLGASEQAQLVQFMTQLQAAGVQSGGVHPAFPWPLPSPPLSGGKKKRKYSGSVDADSDWLPSGKGKPGADETPKRKSRRATKPKTEQSVLSSLEAASGDDSSMAKMSNPSPSGGVIIKTETTASDHRTLRTILSTSSSTGSGGPTTPITPKTPQVSSTISTPPVGGAGDGVKSEPKWDESQYGQSEDTATTKPKEHTPATYELKDSMSLKNVQLDEIPALMTQLQNSGPGVPEYKCKRCTCAFFVYTGIELHLQCHLSEGNELRCFICGFHNHKLAMQWRIMRHHLETAHSIDGLVFAKHRCEIQGCTELFKTTNEYEHHLQKVHVNPGTQAIQSSSGGGVTQTINHHVLLPNGLFDYGCPFCNTPHFKREALDLHIRCHVGQGKNYACFLCNYMHPSQPGSWRFMRGHMQREHPELATQEIFSYFECEHYTCRVKFCTRRARDIHEMCHDEVRDMQFFCFQCGYRALDSNSAFMWEPIKDHIIKHHPQVFDGEFNCSCLRTFSSFASYVEHVSTAKSEENT